MDHTTNLDSDYPTVLFSIETTTRELDSKLVMASALAAQGCRVIVGHKEVLQAAGRASQRVVWQGKTLFSRKSPNHFADALIKGGSAIMYLHDEGAMFYVSSWTEEIVQTHDIDQLSKVDRICVWGTRQKKVISEYSGDLLSRVAVTGIHSLIDLDYR